MLAFSNDYYGIIFRATQSVELFCAYHIKEQPLVTVTYFLPDKTKDGGSYQTLTAPAVKIDTYDERLHLEDDISIAFDDIIDIVIGAI